MGSKGITCATLLIIVGNEEKCYPYFDIRNQLQLYEYIISQKQTSKHKLRR